MMKKKKRLMSAENMLAERMDERKNDWRLNKPSLNDGDLKREERREERRESREKKDGLYIVVQTLRNYVLLR